MNSLSEFGGWVWVAVIVVGLALAAGSSILIRILFTSHTQRVSSQLQAPAAQQVYPPTSPIASQPTTSVTSQTDPTANWKIYRNTKVGFEIKYPASYQTPYAPIKGGLGGSKEVDGSEDYTTISFDQPSISKLGVERILLIVFPYSSTLDELVKNPPSSPYFDYDHPTLKLKELTVDGKQAYWFITTDDLGKQSDMEILFVGKNHGFILQTGLTHNSHEIGQILSAFRFIR